MKIKKIKKRTHMMYVLVAIGFFMQSSCSDDPEPTPVIEPETPGVEMPDAPVKVTTLVQNFQASDGLSVDDEGSIYASDYGDFMGTEVLKVNPNTAAIEVAVNNLSAPTGNTIDASGTIFVVNNVRRVREGSDELQGDVLRVLDDGTRTVIATLPGFPAGITLDEDGNAYVSNFFFPGVHKITPDGEVTVFAQDNRLFGGVGIDFDDSGNLFVGNFSTGAILKISPDSTIEILATIPTVREGVVIGYLTYFDATIYATAPGEHVIYSISMSGEVKILAGTGDKESKDGPLLDASFNTPNGITADPNKKVLYVTAGGANDDGALRVISLD